MTVLIVTYYFSPGPGPSALQSAGRGYVNPFFCVVILVENHPRQHSNRRISRKTIPWTIRPARCSHGFVLIDFLIRRWFLIACLVLRAINAPNIKKYRFLERKLFVTVSNAETTAKTADVRVEKQMAKWNQNLDPLYVSSFPPILCLKVPFSLVKPSSHLTLHLYAKRGSANPDILIGTHEMAIPPASQSGSFS
jgi:hypothetical protein